MPTDALICGAAGGYTNLFLKGVAELVKNLANGAVTDCKKALLSSAFFIVEP